MATVGEEIDDSLYSRQRYVLGDSAMQKMAKSNVLLVNVGGLGVEIAKNIVLAGVKSLTIQDTNIATYHDLGSQFFLREDDVKSKKTRLEASVSRISELNPYVQVQGLDKPLAEDTDLSYLKDYQCVVLTEVPLALQLKLNKFCRSQTLPVKFLSADVFGVFCWCFCDFGDTFEVFDANGEEPKEIFVADISQANPGVVSTLQYMIHGFETDDIVSFRELKHGMEALEGKQHQIKVLSPYSFTICDTTGDEFTPYVHGGIATQVKTPKTAKFNNLEDQLKSPDLLIADFSKFTAPSTIHIGMLALHTFRQTHSRMPNSWCPKDAETFIELARQENKTLKEEQDLDESLLQQLSYTCQGCFPPLAAFLGGVVAQEALKALTGKFTPLKQWLHLDATEVITDLDKQPVSSFQPGQNRSDALRMCIGEELCQKLADVKLFMVGCGAIGCEMIKNYALLGIGTTEKGLITITDNDLIEKSNLNRQFLFRPQHIRKAKSITAAGSARDINAELNIDAHQNKVCPQTESSVYNDAFFESQDIVVNALDNVEARRYMDSRCVTNQKPLLESGTMGAKGHVQIIVPHLTESYTSQRDPPEQEVPYCTLKSFPAQIEHCIQWARDKFESSFAQKPRCHSKFWSNNNTQEVVQKLTLGQSLDGAVTASKTASNRPRTWRDSVVMARHKFQKYFNNRAKSLLHMFPIDTKMQDGSLFWQSPKRPPIAIEFDPLNPTHLSFVIACARLYADISGVQWSESDFDPVNVVRLLTDVAVPAFRPSSKKIEVDENAKKADESEISGDDLKDAANRIQKAQAANQNAFSSMVALEFEKDDDANGHIDFITAASNLRAMMYNIETADRLKTKKIAGRIVPAIATTTAAVAGLVTIELIKILKAAPLEHYKNCFMNLALPVFLFSEPGAVDKAQMKNGVSYTLWDTWDITGHKDFTIEQFLAAIKEKYGVRAGSVIYGVKMLYVPIIPGHKKRFTQPIMKFIKAPADKKYVDLVVGFKTSDDADADEEDGGPPVRYYFGV